MYILKTEYHFDAAHFLAGYNGKCSNLHGHRWKVELEVKSETLQESGQERQMVYDFSTVKKTLKKICDHFDHCFIYEKGSLSENFEKELELANFRTVKINGRPTSENLARIIFEMLENDGIKPYSVTVYETPENYAKYVK